MKFVIKQYVFADKDHDVRWGWTLTGKDGPICHSAGTFLTEAEARSNVAASKTKLSAVRFAKVVNE